MNRRSLSFIFIICLSLLLVGCGIAKENNTGVNLDIAEEMKYKNIDIDGFYDFENTNYSEEIFDEDNKTKLCDFTSDISRIKNPTEDVLFVNKEINGILASGLDLARTNMKDDCKEFIENTGMTEYVFEEDVRNHIEYNSKDLISIYFANYSYWGGAHGTTASYALIFDVPNQKQLMFSDVFNEDKLEDLQKILSDKLLELDADGQIGLFPDYYEGIRYTFDDAANAFYITDEGITFIFGQYLVAPYASGIQFIDLSFDELDGMLKIDFSDMK